MTGDFDHCADILADRLAAFWLADENLQAAWDNRPPGSGIDLTPLEETLIQTRDAVYNAARNLPRPW